MRLKNLLTVSLSLFIGFSAFADHLSDKLLFTARLDGKNATTVVNADANGIASFFLNATRDTMQVNIAVSNLSGPMIAAHIHEGAAGTDGAVILPLDAFIEGNVIRTTITGATLTNNLAKFFDGSFYVNIHTELGAMFGELRGQIKLERDFGFYANLDTIQEVPTPAGSSATGSANFVFDQDKTNLTVNVVTNGLTGAITGAHLHRAPSGSAGGVVMNLSTLISGTKITGTIAVPTELKDSLEILVKTGQIYLNLHTDANGAGEVRGQALASQDLYFDGGITTGQVVAPIMTSSNAYGAGHGYINRSFDEYRYLFIVEADSLTSPITEAGLYVGGRGAAGVLVKTLTVTNGNRIGGKWSKSDATQPLTNANINSFLYGDVYIKISTTANPSGEIRGQLTRTAREGYVFEINTDQEVPAPTVSKVPNGGGMVSISATRTSAHYMAAWDSLSGPVASAHFHKAVPGVAGGVLFTVPTNNNAAFGYWNAANGFTKANELMFRRDSVYLNIHTDANAGGEVRGDVSRGYKISSETGVSTAVNNVLSANNPFQLYPNPVSFNATISMNVETAFEGTVIVTDLTGRQVQVVPFNVTTGESKVSVETSTLTSGVYLLSINSSNGVIATSKFVKQ